MYQSSEKELKEMQEFASLGNEVVAYMREITTEEIQDAFPDTPELEPGQRYWALFAADGSPLVLAETQADVSSSAFYNDLQALLPN